MSGPTYTTLTRAVAALDNVKLATRIDGFLEAARERADDTVPALEPEEDWNYAFSAALRGYLVVLDDLDVMTWFARQGVHP